MSETVLFFTSVRTHFSPSPPALSTGIEPMLFIIAMLFALSNWHNPSAMLAFHSTKLVNPSIKRNIHDKFVSHACMHACIDGQRQGTHRFHCITSPPARSPISRQTRIEMHQWQASIFDQSSARSTCNVKVADRVRRRQVYKAHFDCRALLFHIVDTSSIVRVFLQQWPVRSRPLESQLEERRQGSNLQPRQLARVHQPPAE